MHAAAMRRIWPGSMDGRPPRPSKQASNTTSLAGDDETSAASLHTTTISLYTRCSYLHTIAQRFSALPLNLLLVPPTTVTVPITSSSPSGHGSIPRRPRGLVVVVLFPSTTVILIKPNQIPRIIPSSSQ